MSNAGNNSRIWRVGKEASWIVLGQIVSILGMLVLVRVLTENLEPSQYGRLALGITVATLVNQVITGSLSNGIGRFYSIASEQDDIGGFYRASGRLMFYATLAVLGVGLVLLGGLLLIDYPQWLGIASAVLVFSLFNGYNTTMNGIQNAARQRVIVAFHSGLDAWMKIILVLGVMYWHGQSATSVIIGYALSAFVVSISQFVMLWRQKNRQDTTKKENTKWVREIWAYSWPFSTWGIFTWAQQSSDRWALEAFASTGQVGMYAVLFQLGYRPIAMVTGMAMTFFGPILYQRAGDGTDSTRNASVHLLAWRISFITLSATFIVFFLLLALHEAIFKMLVAEEYRNISNMLPWIVLAGGIFAAGQMLILKLMTEMKTAAMVRVKLTTSIVGVALNYCGAAAVGIQGIVAAALVFSIIYFVWVFLLTVRQQS